MKHTYIMADSTEKYINGFAEIERDLHRIMETHYNLQRKPKDSNHAGRFMELENNIANIITAMQKMATQMVLMNNALGSE